MAADLGLGLWYPLLAIYLKSIGVAVTWIGVLVLARNAISMGMLFVSGNLSDRIGRKKPIVASSLLVVAASVTLFVTNRPLLLIPAFVALGMARALREPAINAYIADITPDKRIGTAFASFMFFRNGAEFIGITVGAGLAEILGFRQVFVISILTGIVGTLTFSLFFRDRRQPMEKSRVAFEGYLETAGASVLQALRSKPMALLLATICLHQGSMLLMLDYVGLYAKDIMGYSLAMVGLILSSRRIGFLLGRIPGGKIADRMGSEKTLLFHVVSSSAMVLLFLMTSESMGTALVMLLFGFTGSFDLPSRNTLTAKYGKDIGVGAAMGIATGLDDLSTMAAPMAGAVLWSTYGPSVPFKACAVINLLSVIPLLLATRVVRTEGRT